MNFGSVLGNIPGIDRPFFLLREFVDTADVDGCMVL
jgi:hypothetical protein